MKPAHDLDLDWRIPIPDWTPLSQLKRIPHRLVECRLPDGTTTLGSRSVGPLYHADYISDADSERMWAAGRWLSFGGTGIPDPVAVRGYNLRQHVDAGDIPLDYVLPRDVAPDGWQHVDAGAKDGKVHMFIRLPFEGSPALYGMRWYANGLWWDADGARHRGVWYGRDCEAWAPDQILLPFYRPITKEELREHRRLEREYARDKGIVR